MEYAKLGNTDIEVSKLCIGCMSFGKAGTMHDWTLDAQESEKVIKHALDLGINFFDTANCYSAGTSEEYLGQALKKNVARDKVVIASKVYFNEGRLSKAAIEWGLTPFATMENHYNLLYREDERELIPICKQMNVALMPYSPLAAGHLSRPVWNTDSLRSQTDRVARGKYDRMEEQDMKVVARVHELSEKHNCKMSQIALAWQWAKGVTAPIVGATKTAYLDDAASALDVKLSAEDVAYLEEMYVPHPIVGAIKENPAQGVVLLDEKK